MEQSPMAACWSSSDLVNLVKARANDVLYTTNNLHIVKSSKLGFVICKKAL